MSQYRVSGRGRVDTSRPVTFTFDGKSYTGGRGDTVASALLAHGVHLMGRSFKYHRPRGAVAAGSEEPNALIGTRRGPGRFEPNTRATVQEIWEGLETNSQNKFPSITTDFTHTQSRLLKQLHRFQRTTTLAQLFQFLETDLYSEFFAEFNMD